MALRQTVQVVGQACLASRSPLVVMCTPMILRVTNRGHTPRGGFKATPRGGIQRCKGFLAVPRYCAWMTSCACSIMCAACSES